MKELEDARAALFDRFDWLRDSGVCSPTTRALLDDAQALIESLSAPPAEDERSALAKLLTGLDDREWAIATAKGTWHLSLYFETADRIIASPVWRNRHREPSAEAIAAAAHVLFRFEYPHERIAFPNDWEADVFRRRARAALEAAESTRTASTEGIRDA